MKDILVTGASQGIGLEFTRQFLQGSHRVFGASRNSEKSSDLWHLKSQHNDCLEIHQLDVSAEDSRERFYQALTFQTEKLDSIINNAGIIAGNEEFSYQFGDLRQEDIMRTLLVNSVAPLMMTEKVFPLLSKGTKPVVVNITSDNGSIARRRSGGKYDYCASKAALNMITKILSNELKKYEIIVIALHPGWVKTPMTKNEDAPLEPSESIQGMIQVIESLEMKDTGKFLDWMGNEIPW
jgi:NAD(P)-dependent dehydrogenase (short-subunit alcohol dehydrogenase family)